MSATNYKWLLDFYAYVVAFEVITSTITDIPTEKRLSILGKVKDLQRELEEILPDLSRKEY